MIEYYIIFLFKDKEYERTGKDYLKDLLKGELIKDDPDEKETWYKLSD